MYINHNKTVYLIFLVLVATIVALTGTTPVYADTGPKPFTPAYTTFSVNKRDDLVDFAPGDGVCDADPTPEIVHCTLRAAIQETNALGGGTIQIPGSLHSSWYGYQLTLSGSGEDNAVSGDLDILTPLTIMAINGTPAIILAQHGDRVFHVLGSGHLTLNNIQIYDGNSSDGGGIYVASSAALTMNDSSIGGGIANHDGGGIYNAGMLVINNSTVAGVADNNGGGIYNLGSLTMENSSISGSTATNGGGLYTLTAPTFVTSTVSDNTATADGGGIYIAAQITLTGTTVTNNTAERGGGIFVGNSISSTIQAAIIQGNQAILGGGLYNGSGNPTITDTQFLTNTVSTDEGCGGGLYNDSGSPTIEGNTFQGNSANGYFNSPTDWAYGRGGGIFNKSGNPIIHNNLLRGNSATGYHANPEPYVASGGVGGGIYNESGSPSVEGNAFLNNTTYGILRYDNQGNPTYISVAKGGGLCNLSGSFQVRENSFIDNRAVAPYGTFSSGGGIENISGNLIIQDNTIEGNSADHGGGISTAGGSVVGNIIRENSGRMVAGIQVGSAVTVTNNLVEGNFGTSIRGSGTSLIQHNTIRNNKALYYGNGSSISITAGSPTIKDNIIEGNEYGGIFNKGEAIIIDNIIRGNSTNRDGAGIASFSGNPVIANNQIISNTITQSAYACGDGGGIYVEQGEPVIHQNMIISNTIVCSGSSSQSGGGIYNREGNPIISSNIIADNRVSVAQGVAAGGGLYSFGGKPRILNNTIVGNSANGALRSSGGGVYLYNQQFYDFRTETWSENNFTFHNNIVVNNIVAGADGVGGGIFSEPNIGRPNLDYNDVWNNTGGDYSGIAPGAHDISADPLFVNESSSDYHLAPGSPCIDTGDFIYRGADDFDGDPRPMGLAPDIGADETRAFGVAKSGPTQVRPGETFTYTIRVVNLTSGSAAGVKITDTLPTQVALLGSQAHGLSCAHDGSPWGGALLCTTIPADMAPGISHAVTLTVQAANVPSPVDITNFITATASSGNLLALDRATTAISWCQVRLNDGPIGSDLQEAIGASTQERDVVKVSGHCAVHDVYLDRTLTLQGGWSYNFAARDSAIYVTTLDAQGNDRILSVSGENPVIEGFFITGGKVSDQGGGMSIGYGSSPIIRDNVFWENIVSGSGTVYGGAIYSGGSPTIQNNRFMSNQVTATGNESDGSAAVGGAIYTSDGNPVIVNNGFYGNTASAFDASGGAIYNNSSDAVILNNTIISNTAIGPWDYGGGSGGGIYDNSATATIRNNIITDNTAEGTYFDGGGISSSGNMSDEDYNDLWGNRPEDYSGTEAGPHDISVNPKLANPAVGDFHLLAGSPCIDTGDPSNYPPTDFEGDARPMGLSPDIGADEYASSARPDVDEDGDVDADDINMVAGQWRSAGDPSLDQNGDGRIDILDIVTVCSHYGE